MESRTIFFEVGGWLIMGCLTLIVVLLFLKLIQRFGFIFRALDYLTMPGAIFHELGHYLACKAHGIRVYEVKWFHWGYMVNRERASNETRRRLGFVKFAGGLDIYVLFQIGAAPLLSCGMFWLLGITGVHLLISETSPFNSTLTPFQEAVAIIFFLWIGLASADRMLPSKVDMLNVLENEHRSTLDWMVRAPARLIIEINKALYRYINGVPAWGVITSLTTLYILLRFSIPGGQAYLEPIGVIADAIREFAEASKNLG